MNDKEARLDARLAQALQEVGPRANLIASHYKLLVETDGPKIRIHWKRYPQPGEVYLIIYNIDTEMVIASIAGSKVAMHPMHYQWQTVHENLAGIVRHIEEAHNERTATRTDTPSQSDGKQ